MANNDLSVRASSLTIQPKLENKQQEQVKQSAASPLSGPEQASTLIQVQQEEQKEGKAEEALQDKVAQLNQHMQTLNRNLQFSVDEVSGETVVTVVDAETDEVVRQIPSQEVLDARNAVEQYRGILLETKV